MTRGLFPPPECHIYSRRSANDAERVKPAVYRPEGRQRRDRERRHAIAQRVGLVAKAGFDCGRNRNRPPGRT
jgi:hypothetical protein